MLSARALGIYVYLERTGAPINAEKLSKVFKEGREAIAAALRELKALGIITSKKTRIGRNIITENTLVEPGFWAPETRRQYYLYDYTNFKAHNVYIPTNINNHPTKSDKKLSENLEGDNEDFVFESFESNAPKGDDDFRKAAKVRREEKAADYRETVSRKVSKFKSRFGVPVEDWTPTDLSFEFADRLNLTMKLPPWNVSTTPLAAAISKSQQKMEISNDDVCTLMDMYFQSLSIKSTDSAEVVWKMFIKYVYANASKLKNFVKETDEVTEEDRLRSIRAMERFLGDV